MAAQVDETKLPSAAAGKVDFVRDIKPILENHCLKCHGGEKPKSHFRLTSREEALKGGENGIDILPGQSAKSPLIHYVARLIPDMEMPPEGRGTPLSAQQVGLLRAWIDQGVVWESAQPHPVQAAASPTVGWTTVHGDAQKFRELYWQPDGWNGGLEDFELVDRPGADSKITTAGHVLRDDYKLTLSAQKTDLGFARFGWAQFRKYSDDTGGYYSLFSTPAFELGRDLHLDVGKAWADFGLTLPKWPTIVLGYEYQYRDGADSTLAWGPVRNGTITRNIYPAFKEISEKVHLLKLDIDYDAGPVHLGDSFRGEWYELATRRLNESGYALGGSGMALTSAAEQQTYFQGANTVHAEGQFTDWLFASGGYLYSRLNGDNSLEVETLNPVYLDPTGLFPPGWNAQQIRLERESHVFSVGTRLGPWEGLTLSLGVQNEWTRQTGLGSATVDVALPFNPLPLPLGPEQVYSDMDRSIFTEEAGLRFTKIPFTTLYAEARFQQDNLGQLEQEIDGLTPFLRNTDTRSDEQNFRAGFTTSPWRWVSLSGHVLHYDKSTDYDHLLKEALGQPFEGYPAFIRWRDLVTDEAEGRLSLQWNRWLKTSLSYQWLDTEYRTATDPVTVNLATGQPADITPGSRLLAGTYRSHIASLNATLTPWQRAFLSLTLVYQNARTVTFANDGPSVAPYAGDIYSAVISGTYALDAKTSLVAAYSFATADFEQDNLVAGLPLGISYRQHTLQAGIKRQLAKNTALTLQYRFYSYHEPTSGSLTDFQAHAVFATMAFAL